MYNIIHIRIIFIDIYNVTIRSTWEYTDLAGDVINKYDITEPSEGWDLRRRRRIPEAMGSAILFPVPGSERANLSWCLSCFALNKIVNFIEQITILLNKLTLEVWLFNITTITLLSHKTGLQPEYQLLPRSDTVSGQLCGNDSSMLTNYHRIQYRTLYCQPTFTLYGLYAVV